MTTLERLSTLPGLRHAIDVVRALPLPVPVRLFDGVSRIGTPRLYLLAGVWRRVPRALDESQRVYDAYAGGDVIDIGAFQGWYSALLAPRARPGDRLISCEPDVRAYRGLLANLQTLSAMFPALRLWALPEPIGDGAPVVVTDPSAHHPSFRAQDDASGAPSITVDALVEAARLEPSFVKIDVEGAEWAVLAGMQRTLGRHRPVVMLELHPQWLPHGVSSDDVTGLLASHGYEFTEIGEKTPVTLHLLCRPRQGR